MPGCANVIVDFLAECYLKVLVGTIYTKKKINQIVETWDDVRARSRQP